MRKVEYEQMVESIKHRKERIEEMYNRQIAVLEAQKYGKIEALNETLKYMEESIIVED